MQYIHIYIVASVHCQTVYKHNPYDYLIIMYIISHLAFRDIIIHFLH